MAQKKYVSLSKLSTFLDNLKNLFVSKESLDSLETVVNAKAEANHAHDDAYYTKSQINKQVSDTNAYIATSLNEAKLYSNTNLNTAKAYTDDMVAQRTQVQIITWEADD